MAGVLLWIGLAAGAASRKSEKVARKWFSALAMRCSIILCFEHQEPTHATLLRMGDIIEGVGYRTPSVEVGSVAAGPEKSPSLNPKRRRV